MASRKYPGVLWVIEDSGNPPVVTALETDGSARGTLTLEAENVDWEDLALGPCPEGTCLYVADIGDNDADRNDIAILRVPEPDASQSFDETATPERIDVVYSDGPQNAESFVVTPDGEMAIFTKRADDTATLWLRGPTDTSWSAAGSVSTGAGSEGLGAQATGADLDPDGERLLVRTYAHVWMWRVPDHDLTRLAEAERASLPSPVEPQGEAIGWTATGCGYWTVSEGVQRPLFRVECQ